MSSKNIILNKIKMALEHPTPLPFPGADKDAHVFQPQQQELIVEFAEQFTQLQGKFIFCIDENELITNFEKLCYQNQWTKIYCTDEKWLNVVPPNIQFDDISTCEVSVTGCETLVARTGSMVLSSTYQGRIPSVYAPIHVCIAYSSQLVYDINDALNAMKNKYREYLPSFITFATGPSRTADIEKTLVVGVHGPKEVYCFIVDDAK